MTNKLRYRVEPAYGKCRYYDDLSEVTSDFNKYELLGGSVSILINAAIIVYFTDDQVSALYNELYQD